MVVVLVFKRFVKYSAIIQLFENLAIFKELIRRTLEIWPSYTKAFMSAILNPLNELFCANKKTHMNFKTDVTLGFGFLLVK